MSLHRPTVLLLLRALDCQGRHGVWVIVRRNWRIRLDLDQVLLQPSRDLVAAVQGADPLVIPLFSPRAVLILNFNEVQAPMHVVAMSPSVGQAATDMNADTVVVAKSPTYHDMVDSTCHVMTQLFDRIG